MPSPMCDRHELRGLCAVVLTRPVQDLCGINVTCYYHIWTYCARPVQDLCAWTRTMARLTQAEPAARLTRALPATNPTLLCSNLTPCAAYVVGDRALPTMVSALATIPPYSSTPLLPLPAPPLPPTPVNPLTGYAHACLPLPL